MPCLLPHAGAESGHYSPGFQRGEAYGDYRRASGDRENHPQEGVPEDTEQPHAASLEHACDKQEGQPEDM